MTDNTLFETTPQTSKYDTWEPDALKKKALAADDHIATLENELSTLRSANSTDARIQEVLQKLDQLSTNSYQNQSSTTVNQTAERNVPTAEVTKEDVLRLVSTTLEQKTKENQVKENVAKVHRELKAAWGENYKNILSTKAQEMGVNQDFLASMAETHPDAFLKLMVDKNKLANPNVHVPPTTIQINTATGPLTIGDTWKDFSKAMKDNPNLKHDPAFNRRMHEAAQRLGDSFYK